MIVKIKPVIFNGFTLMVGLWGVSAATFGLSAGAQPPPIAWSKQISGPYGALGNMGVALDGHNNLYVAAAFNPLQFNIGNQTLTNRSVAAGTFGQNGFLAKFSGTGDFLWARQIGGTWNDQANACATDSAGNIYVTGMCGSTNLDIDGVQLSTSAGSFCFIAKYDAAGNVLWARQSTGGLYQASGTSVAVDTAGNSFVAGFFDSSNVVFGTNSLANSGTSSNNPVYQDFLVKYDPAGNVLWAKAISVNNNMYFTPALAVDKAGNSFFCDTFSGNAQVGDFAVNCSTGVHQAGLLAKFDPAGTALWATQVAAPTNGGGIYSGTIAADPQGNCLAAGYYSYGSAVFPTNVLPAPVPAYGYNGYLAKFDATGNFLWDTALLSQWNPTISVDAAGNTCSAGFNVVSKFDPQGNVLWATNSLGLGGIVSGAVDPAGTFFVVGSTGTYYADGLMIVQLSGPTLSIGRLGDQLAISWPTNEAGLGLESAASLSGPWSFLTNPVPTVIGNNYLLTNGLPAAPQFYRLAVP